MMTVKHVMSTKVFTMRPDKKLFVVGELMEWAHVRHVPVVDDHGRLVGIVSHRDLLRASVSSVESRVAMAERRQHLTQITVAQVMQAPTHTVTPETTVRQAAATMRTFHVGCLPVIEHGVLVGIVTAHDMLGLIVHSPSLSEPRASSAA
jgi:CBS domain-containing protein